ncbi:MAG TPA: four helix bundle protein [Planctomycetota bacterium]|nr:four helix bundle protein [Planctomycetota bacterium]
MSPFDKFRTWRRAHELALAVFRSVEALPPGGRADLASEVRRAAVNLPVRIARAAGERSPPAGSPRAWDRSRAAALRLDYLLLLARDLGWLAPAECGALRRRVAAVEKLLATGTRRGNADGHP